MKKNVIDIDTIYVSALYKGNYSYTYVTVTFYYDAINVIRNDVSTLLYLL